MAPWAHRRRLTAALFIACSLAMGCSSGCARNADPSDTISVTWALDPSPPVTGAPMVARLTLRDEQQRPVSGARLRLEGLMSHPGMAPVTADLAERGDGTYEAPFQFTMAGDWILLVTGDLEGGGKLRKQIEIPGVRPAS